MKRIAVYALCICLFSCSGIKKEEPNKSDIATETLVLVAEGINQTPTQEVKSLSGMHFVLGGAMREGVCVITEACDCCNADLMFLSDTEFIYDDLCEGHYVRKGTYRLKGNELILEFESLLVSFYHNEESETDPTQPERILKSEPRDSSVEVYTIGKCKDSIMLTNIDTTEDAVFAVGTLREKTETKERIQNLKEIGVWKLLTVK